MVRTIPLIRSIATPKFLGSSRVQIRLGPASFSSSLVQASEPRRERLFAAVIFFSSQSLFTFQMGTPQLIPEAASIFPQT
jgi:hypothetical protein